MAYKLYSTIILLTLLVFLTENRAQTLEKTQILVLGTVHLNHFDGIKSDYVNRVIDSLSQMKFDVVGIEKMSPELLLDIRSRNSKHWQELYSYFSKSIEMGEFYQNYYSMNYDNAELLIDSLLTKAILTEQERVSFIKAALCSYDPWTAALHYQYLPEDMIADTSIVSDLENYVTSNNEINLIAINLAMRLNIKKLFPIDNLQDETILLHHFPEFLNEYKNSQNKIAKLFDNPFFHKKDSIISNSIAKRDLFDIYKFVNSKEYMEGDKKGQWDIWYETNFKSKTDRSRYSLWEMRNLQITANIMRLVAGNQGKKILILIGASHKSFIEKHLKQISDIEIMNFN